MLSETELKTLQHVTLLDILLQRQENLDMRRRMSRSKSRKNFRRNSGVHPKNNRTPNQRGGYRL